MSDLSKIFLLACGLFFVGVMLNLLVKRKINEKNSLRWLFASIVVLVLSAVPDFLDQIAVLVGIKYPPALLFLLSTLVLLWVSLNQSMQISVLNEQVKELAQIISVEQSMNKNPLCGVKDISNKGGQP